MKIKLLLAAILISSIAFAQHRHKGKHQEKSEKIKAKKIAYITEKLDLTPEEAQVFWPVFNEYLKKQAEIALEKITIMKTAEKNETVITEKEYESLSDKITENKVAEANLFKDYHIKLKKVLPKKKLFELYQAEHMFKKQLIRDIKRKEHRDKPDIVNDDHE